MATVVKTAGIVAMFRIFSVSFTAAHEFWTPTLSVLAALTMVIGNLSALMQKSLKRMLAYSSVAHAGYLLLAILTHNSEASKALLLYMAGYGLAALVAFALIHKMKSESGNEHAEWMGEKISFGILRAAHQHVVYDRNSWYRRVCR
jgi:NADH-quinone oxidoreductase subunit N